MCQDKIEVLEKEQKQLAELLKLFKENIKNLTYSCLYMFYHYVMPKSNLLSYIQGCKVSTSDGQSHIAHSSKVNNYFLSFKYKF